MTEVLHGLLQTPAYARALMAAGMASSAPVATSTRR
ncbi:Scr1 family TA system antitoxin-like transcriptional regulator [Nocardia amikacinitolerans]